MSDAILVLGGGVREGATLPPWVQARFDRALELARGEWIVALSAGTPHRPPPLDEQGFPIFESIAGAQYLIEKGYDPDRVLVETCSYDTIGNAYFSRVLHADPRHWRSLTVVTSEFHLARAEIVFRWVYGLDAAAELKFCSAPDKGIPPDKLLLRCTREEQGRVNAVALASRIRTMADLTQWLYTGHSLYAAGQLSLPRPAAPAGVAELY